LSWFWSYNRYNFILLAIFSFYMWDWSYSFFFPFSPCSILYYRSKPWIYPSSLLVCPLVAWIGCFLIYGHGLQVFCLWTWSGHEFFFGFAIVHTLIDGPIIFHQTISPAYLVDLLANLLWFVINKITGLQHMCLLNLIVEFEFSNNLLLFTHVP
jgi:hypothetical protein